MTCFRPKGHPGTRHMGEASYRRMLERNRTLRKRARRARRRENDSGR